tara:strand:- start:395 stop:658 length:264 start_codon:yes stop_codon:yes gene_type:complete
MKQQELIEMIQQHHPDAGEVIIRTSLNRAQDDFTAKTQIIDAVADDTLAKDQRFYVLDPGMLEIKRVELDDIVIPRLIGKPDKGDIT